MPDGFNIVLCRNKLLAELDRTVYEIRRGFVFEKAGKTLDTRISGGHEILERIVIWKF